MHFLVIAEKTLCKMQYTLSKQVSFDTCMTAPKHRKAAAATDDIHRSHEEMLSFPSSTDSFGLDTLGLYT